MPFDDTYNSYESFKLAHTEPVLVADRTTEQQEKESHRLNMED